MIQSNWQHPFKAGIKAAIGMPALGLFSALFGYGILNIGMGIDFIVMLGAVIFIWSMPALMTFTELMAIGVGAGTMFIGVIFANLRNIPMVVTALPLIRAERRVRWNDLLFAQLLSPTGWVHILIHASKLPIASRRKFFTAFSLTIFLCAITGACTGYFLADGFPTTLTTALLLLTPLYLLLIMVSVPNLSGYISLGFGAIAIPLLMHWSIEWGLALGGIGAGTLGFLFTRKLKQKNNGH